MKRGHVPLIDGRYWLAILLASVFGTNLGDLYVHDSGLGLGLGLLVLAALAATAFTAERLDERPHVGWYWLVIVIIRTGATNIADWLAFGLHVPQPLLVLLLGALIASFGALSAARRSSSAARGEVLPNTDGAYWVAMLSAGVFGTVVGDVCSQTAGELAASLALLSLFAAALILRRGGVLPAILTYWLTIAIARSAGTSVGDWLAENGTLKIGLPLSTALSAGAFLLSIAMPSRRVRDADHRA